MACLFKHNADSAGDFRSFKRKQVLKKWPALPCIMVVILISMNQMIFAGANTWLGSDTTTGNAYREGNVGIGCTPTTPLDVACAQKYQWTAHFQHTLTGGHNVYIGYNNYLSTPSARYGVYIADGGGDANSYDLIIPNKFMVRGDGLVGIGCTPTTQLEIAAAVSTVGLQVVGANNQWTHIVHGGGTANQSYGLDIQAGTSNVDYPLYIRSHTLTLLMAVRGDGNVGIGTASPGYKLEVAGTAAASTVAASTIRVGLDEGHLCITPDDEGGYGCDIGHYVTVFNTSNDSTVTVDGGIAATTITVDKVIIDNWTIEAPDYVFSRNYALPRLAKVESFIQQNKHLPDVPSAKQMKKNGVDLAEMNMTLLKKVEELTLYMIEQDKRIKELEKKVAVKN